jgi:hypothetical protein
VQILYLKVRDDVNEIGHLGTRNLLVYMVFSDSEYFIRFNTFQRMYISVLVTNREEGTMRKVRGITSPKTLLWDYNSSPVTESLWKSKYNTEYGLHSWNTRTDWWTLKHHGIIGKFYLCQTPQLQYSDKMMPTPYDFHKYFYGLMTTLWKSRNVLPE